MRYLIAVMLLFMSLSVQSQMQYPILVLDYDFDQDCSSSPVCFGFLDFTTKFTYHVGDDLIQIETFRTATCQQDGIRMDRFEPNITIELNGVKVGTAKRVQYFVGANMVQIDTNELNFNCY